MLPPSALTAFQVSVMLPFVVSPRVDAVSVVAPVSVSPRTTAESPAAPHVPVTQLRMR